MIKIIFKRQFHAGYKETLARELQMAKNREVQITKSSRPFKNGLQNRADNGSETG